MACRWFSSRENSVLTVLFFLSREFRALFLSQVVSDLPGLRAKPANDCLAGFLLLELGSAVSFAGRILTDIGQNLT